jgi:glycosyltransferase involved in cell wall biosynthesis
LNILWIDPVNSDPQFVNLISIILKQAGHRVTIRSNARHIFDVPSEIEWIPFSTLKLFPTSLEHRPITKMGFATLYPFDWFRACLFARQRKDRSILFSTNLALPILDTFYLRFLKRSKIAPVVIVHRPYLHFFEDIKKEKAYRYKKFYEAASLILVMTKYTEDQLRSLYDLPKNKFYSFKIPHLQPLLNRYETSIELLTELKTWCSGAPVISYLSEISYEHGFDNLLESLPFLNKLLPKYKLIIVARLANKRYRINILEKLNKCGLNGSYKWHWDTYSFSNLKAYLRVTTVTILPYNFATQSQCLPMSSGMGIPVVATSVGGLSEMIRPGINGELAPPRNPMLLAETIYKVVSNSKSYGERSKAYAKQEFSPIKAAKIINHSLLVASL